MAQSDSDLEDQGLPPMIQRRTLLRLFGIVASVAAVDAIAAACTSATPTTSAAPTSSAAVTGTGSAAIAGFPSGGKNSTLEKVGKTGGHVTHASTSEALTMNPMLSADGASGDRTSLIFRPLLLASPDDGMPYPELAEAVPTKANGGISADALTYTFKIRQGVKWHDGTPFTAQDVVFTYQSMMNADLGSPRTSSLVARIDTVNAPDDKTVVFKLKQPVAAFLIDDVRYGIVPRHVLKDTPLAQVKTHPLSTGEPKSVIGTGPFKLKEWVRDDHMTLEANKDYFRGPPAVDEYVFRVVKDTNALVAALKSGAVDFTGGFPAGSYDLVKSESSLNAVTYDVNGATFLHIQLDPSKTTLFQDKRVRQALAYAIDRETNVKTILNGLGQVAHGTIFPTSWAYAPDQIKTKYNYDPKKAEQLLDDAGWKKGADGIRAKDGVKLQATLYTTSGNTTRANLVTALQQYWKAVGVDITPKFEEFGTLITRLREQHDFQLGVIGNGTGSDPDQTVFWATSSYGSGINFEKYSNARVDEILRQGLIETDQAKRKDLYLEMQNILVDELPAFFLDFPKNVDVVSKRVHNVRPNTNYFGWNAHLWWTEDGK